MRPSTKSIKHMPCAFSVTKPAACGAYGRGAAGATVLRAIKDEFYGDRTGMIADPFGHKWHVSTRKEELSPQEMQRRWNEMFQG